jgi:hypothetical protein
MNYYDDVNKIKLKHACLLLRALAFSDFHSNYYYSRASRRRNQLSRA